MVRKERTGRVVEGADPGSAESAWEVEVPGWGVWLAGCILVAARLMPGPVAAAPGSVAAAGAAAEQVLQRDEEMAHAIVSADLASLEDIYAADYVYVGSDGRQVTRAERVGALRSGALRYLATEHTGATVRSYGETAIVQGRTHSKVLLDGRTIEGDFQYVGVWVRQRGRWRIVLTQATRIAG